MNIFYWQTADPKNSQVLRLQGTVSLCHYVSAGNPVLSSVRIRLQQHFVLHSASELAFVFCPTPVKIAMILFVLQCYELHR